MKPSQRIRIAALGAVTVLVVSVTGSCTNRKLVLYNHTPSVPIGWYVYAGRSPKVGDIIAFTLPTPAHDYARSRNESTHVRLLKPVLAVRGDRVNTVGGELRINGVLFGTIAVTDAAGRTLPHWQADRVLVDDELLVGSTAEHSFDGRFFGPIHAAQVQGVYRRLAIGSTSDAPNEPTPSRALARINVTSTTPRQ